jgi:elongation factor Ts
MTNAGIMDCKKALVETQGDLGAAVDLLRKRGRASAAKKALRETREGLVVQHLLAGARQGALAEINCQTDFVAKNETFRAFADSVVRSAAEGAAVDWEPTREELVAKTGENVRVARCQRLEVSGVGLLAAYIHTGAKIGVLVEVGAEREATLELDAFRQLARDLTLQVAAASPVAVSREQVDPALIAKEREIGAEQVKNKPPQAIAKIVEGKLEKYFQTVCLLDQGFVKKNGEITVREHVASVGKEVGDTLTVRRFLRYQVGEAFAG